MEPAHPLKTILQFYLATDASSVLHLPHVLSSLTQESLSAPSSHLPKWITRINSLLHSKDAGARWAGLCLAHQTSFLSKNTMIECAQNWLGVALPLLSRKEPIPTLKASIRLLQVIFSAGVGMSEYQRQTATPNVTKFMAAIIGLAESPVDEGLTMLILTTLTQLVPLYPTLSRGSHTSLSTLSLRFLNGRSPNPISDSLLKAASHLYSVLHFTGGKVGAANLWRKSVDETLVFGWSAFTALRTSFRSEGHDAVNPPYSIETALIAIPLNLDRLRCCIAVLSDLISSTAQRTVQLPLGPFVKFIDALLGCTMDDKGMEHTDPTILSMESSVIPQFWKFGCQLTSCLARCARHHLTPHLTHLISYLTFHLEQRPTASERLFILSAIESLLIHCHPLDSPLVPTRLTKAVLPSLSIILATPPEMQLNGESAEFSHSHKKGKKRSRGYEGDEIFKLSREVICPGLDDGKVLTTALHVMRLLLHNPNLSPAIQSISARVLISILLSLPQMSPASLSPDPQLHSNILQLVQSINTELGTGTTSVMSKSLGLVIRAALTDDSNAEIFHALEVLLHPRVPPLVRSLPHVESLSLFRTEEPQEEVDTRKELGLRGIVSDPKLLTHEDENVIMDNSSFSPATNHNHSSSTAQHILPPLQSPQTTSPAPVPVATNTQGNIFAPPTPLSQPPTIKPPHPTGTVQEKVPPGVLASQPVAMLSRAEDDEDGEMPVINMESDSDEE